MTLKQAGMLIHFFLGRSSSVYIKTQHGDHSCPKHMHLKIVASAEKTNGFKQCGCRAYDDDQHDAHVSSCGYGDWGMKQSRQMKSASKIQICSTARVWNILILPSRRLAFHQK